MDQLTRLQGFSESSAREAVRHGGRQMDTVRGGDKRVRIPRARWIQCEEAISEFGFLAKHPTTGAAIASPYVTMENQYMKAINQCWYQIAAIVKEHSADGFGASNPQDDLMERLLRSGG